MSPSNPTAFQPLKALSMAALTCLAADCVQGASSPEQSWSLRSPDQACEISVTLEADGALTYQASRQGNSVIQRSPLGLRRDDQDFRNGLKLESATEPQSQRESYELFTGPKSKVDQLLNRRTLIFRNANEARLALDLAASDEGVAFRYRFADKSTRVYIIEEELTGFRVPADTRAWLQPYHTAGPYTPAYEDFYFQVTPGDLPPESRSKPFGWAFPGLFRVSGAQSNTWVLITESGTDAQYCGCHLDADSTGGLYRIRFPADNEFTKGQTNALSSSPRHALPWTMPWRVLVMGASAGDLAVSTLVTDLASPARIDTAWVKPGRASWAWWSYPDGPPTTNMFNQFSDFAARMKWEYTLFDAGWWKPGLHPIAAHARSEGLRPLAWCFAGDFYDQRKRERKLDEVTEAGVAGVKVDFWCSDRQEAMTAIYELLADAARRHLVVNLHGCTLPRGWQRTWPNFLTAEAVLGTESYFYESHYSERAAELNATLPFTRNAVGPTDYTPVACSPKKYKRTTSAAHELATSIVFTSGLIHFADRPEFFQKLPAEAFSIIRDAPARWDESRCLAGEPGQIAVFGRRTGQEWFFAGINGANDPRKLDLDLIAFEKWPKRLLVTEDPGDPQMKVIAQKLDSSSRFQHTVPGRGGFILRLSL